MFNFENIFGKKNDKESGNDGPKDRALDENRIKQIATDRAMLKVMKVKDKYPEMTDSTMKKLIDEETENQIKIITDEQKKKEVHEGAVVAQQKQNEILRQQAERARQGQSVTERAIALDDETLSEMEKAGEFDEDSRTDDEVAAEFLKDLDNKKKS